MYKYSIIVPIYNGEKYLERCVNSIINQTYTNIELILINDGSIDNTEKICKKYSNNDDRVIYIKQDNYGVSYSRNNGIKNATGDYITFVDADDYININTINELNKIISYNQCDILKYSYIKESKWLKKSYKFSIQKEKKILKDEYVKEVIPYMFNTFDLSNVWNAVFKIELIKDKKFDEKLKYAEDFKFMIESTLNSKSLYIDSRTFYHYVYNKNSTINSIKENDIKDRLIDTIRSCMNIQEKNNFSDEVKIQIKNRIKNSIMKFCAYNVSNKSYENYLKHMKNILNDEDYKKLEDKYYFLFNEYIWKDIYEYNYYRQIVKYNLKTKIKKLLIN